MSQNLTVPKIRKFLRRQFHRALNFFLKYQEKTKGGHFRDKIFENNCRVFEGNQKRGRFGVIKHCNSNTFDAI